MEIGVEWAPEYTYLGDKITDQDLKGRQCRAVRKAGKCIRGRNGSMLVEFIHPARKVVVMGRLLRKMK